MRLLGRIVQLTFAIPAVPGLGQDLTRHFRVVAKLFGIRVMPIGVFRGHHIVGGSAITLQNHFDKLVLRN